MSNATNKSSAREYSFLFLYHLQDLFKNDHFDLANELEDFERSYNEPDSELTIQQLNQPLKQFAHTFIEGVLSNRDNLIEKISTFLTKRPWDKIEKIEKTILLMGCYELNFVKDTPHKVVINECINLSKKYGSEDSYTIVNGVLDKMAKNIK